MAFYIRMFALNTPHWKWIDGWGFRFWRCSTKGQTKSKWFFQANISSKKRTSKSDFTNLIPQFNLFSFFGRNWRCQKDISKLTDHYDFQQNYETHCSCLVRSTSTERSSPDIDNCKNISDNWNCLDSNLSFIHPSHVPETSAFITFFHFWSVVPDELFICRLTYWLGSLNALNTPNEDFELWTKNCDVAGFFNVKNPSLLILLLFHNCSGDWKFLSWSVSNKKTR